MQSLFFKLSQSRKLGLVSDNFGLESIHIRAYELLYYSPLDELIVHCLNPIHLVLSTEHQPHTFYILEQKLPRD